MLKNMGLWRTPLSGLIFLRQLTGCIQHRSLLDPPNQIGKERVGRHAKQGIHADDQGAALPPRGQGAQIDAEMLRGIGLQSIKGIARREGKCYV
jgi:hypothetical protein